MRRGALRRAGCLLLALLWIGLGQAPAPGAGPILTRLRIGQVGGLSDAAIFIADDKGFFREQGIELEMARFNSAAQMVAPLATGQLDIGGGAPSVGLFNAIARGIPVKIVADKGNMNAAQQNWFLHKGSQKTRVDLMRVVDNQYVDWVVRQLGPYG